MATILQILNADRNLSLFSQGIKVVGLEDKLSEIGPFTILGPVNLAINQLSSLSYKQLLEPANHGSLLDFLSGYVLIGKKLINDFRNKQQLPALNGSNVTVSITGDETYINGVKILSRNRQGSNGVIHLLDKTYPVTSPG